MSRLQEKNYIKLSFIATIITAISTATIAWAYFSQIDIMKETLEVLRISDQTNRAPLLKVHLHYDIKKTSIVNYLTTDEGGERWEMPYWISNTSKNIAYDLKYFHVITENNEYELPVDSLFENRYSLNTIFANDLYNCGSDQFLRQQAIDLFNKNKCLYRHFFLKYKDDLNNEFVFHAIWKICAYEKGLPLSFESVLYRRVK